ncbi:MAG TPA: hypothetical protein VEI74_01950 [Candidatus Methylomirabilis sp.]|nr:hypothetical protein [Candidatus Methylomirabilis sp.]
MVKVLTAAICVVLTVAPLNVAMSAAPEQRPVPEVQLPIPRPATPSAQTVSRGQLLYENHCIACHESVVHVRHDRRAQSYKALQEWVVRWSNQQQLGWGAGEIADVVDYLNRRYYKFPSAPGGQ